MQRKPFLRLPDTVVVKFMVYFSRAERFDQIAPDVPGKLAFVN
jgi:hypothetical protein